MSFLEKLPLLRSDEFAFSRTCIREALSKLFGINPFDIPLFAPPGLPPVLQNNMGYISISHCKDALLIGWSLTEIGVDIELSNRIINSERIVYKIFNEKELKDFFSNKNGFLKSFIKRWVIKESLLKWQKEFKWEDTTYWNWKLGQNFADNDNLSLKLKVFQSKFLNWEIGVATESLKEDLKIICFQNNYN